MFIGYMPQQQENAGFRTQRAKRGCRFCFIEESIRADLDFDIINEGRYHHQTIAMRDHLESIKGTGNREKYASKWGLATSYPPLLKMAPAIDIILSFPGDPAHILDSPKDFMNFLSKESSHQRQSNYMHHSLELLSRFRRRSRGCSHRFIT